MTVEIFEPDKLYLAADVALDIIATETTRTAWRHHRRGPSFIKMTPGPRGRIVYLGSDLNAYLTKRRVSIEA